MRSVQTFLPHPDFKQSAACLDKRRCWKQVIEANTLRSVLAGKVMGWRNHPVAKMWGEYANALDVYYNAFFYECLNERKIKIVKLSPAPLHLSAKYPAWLGDSRLHGSHRANLLRKNFSFYSQYNWEEANDESYLSTRYYWPTCI